MSRLKIKHKHLAFSNQTYDQLLNIKKEFGLPMYDLDIAMCGSDNLKFDVWVYNYTAFKITYHKKHESTRI